MDAFDRIISDRQNTSDRVGPRLSAFGSAIDAAEQRRQQEMLRKIQAAKDLSDRLSMDEAARSPYVQHMVQQATQPVDPFVAQDPASFAPPTAQDVGTLQESMPPMPGPVPGGSAFTPAAGAGRPGSVNVSLGDISFDATPYDMGDSAFESAALDAVTGRVNQMKEQQTLKQDLNRPASPAERRQFVGPGQPAPGPRNAREMELGKKPMEQLVERRKTEETSRRALQVEAAKGKNKARDTQLVTAAKLLMNLRTSQTALAVAIERAKAVMAKGKKTGQDLKILKDGWTQARTHADAAKAAEAELYQAGAAGAAKDSPEFAQYQEAQSEAARAREVMLQYERAYTDAANQLGKGPGKGGTVRMTDPSGKAYDVDASEADEAARNGWKRG